MLIVRRELPEDIASIRYLNEQAFGQKEEAEIVDKLRNNGTLSISLVAVHTGEILGHIAFSPVVIESENSNFEAIALAPMAVLPAYQGKGFSSRLVRPILERIDREQLPCFVETNTERNVAIYRQFGFEVISEQKIPGKEVTTFAMLRKV